MTQSTAPSLHALPSLSPAQRSCYDASLYGLRSSQFVSLYGSSGCGISLVLRHLHSQLGGAFISAADLFAADPAHPLALEESLARLLTEKLKQHELLIVDDLRLLLGVMQSECGGSYPRSNYVRLLGQMLVDMVSVTGKRVLMGSAHGLGIGEHTRFFSVADFTAEDYRHICRGIWGQTKSARVDFDEIFRFARKLSGHDLRKACTWLLDEPELSTQRVIKYLETQELTSNVDLRQVAPMAFSDLKGMDDLLLALETNLIGPLENHALAAELGIKPKRGILLAGPPGTGKTSVGRALAHRLKSKFFLIDGTFISDLGNFYAAVDRIFEAAAQNIPAIIFIDDTDVIFEGGQTGLYRYLLTKLDGLESEEASRICVMMTAMNVASLPPALIRSGRIELWLETRVPDEAGRGAILRDLVTKGPEAFRGLHVNRLAKATEGLTGADLKRLFEDGKLLYAYDRMKNHPLREPTNYFLDAVETVRQNKQRYAEADAAVRRRRPNRTSYYDSPDINDDDVPF